MKISYFFENFDGLNKDGKYYCIRRSNIDYQRHLNFCDTINSYKMSYPISYDEMLNSNISQEVSSNKTLCSSWKENWEADDWQFAGFITLYKVKIPPHLHLFDGKTITKQEWLELTLDDYGNEFRKEIVK